MTRRWLAAAAALVLVAACNGDDDDAAESTVSETTVAPTDPPATTEAPMTTTSTTMEATTTTRVDEEALKAQIAADYLAVQQALEDLKRAPSLENLDQHLDSIAVPGSEEHAQIRANIERDVASGERVVPGDPDYSDVLVEAVELPEGPAGQTAVVTACLITNEMLVNADGEPILTGPVIAARIRDTVQHASNGWRLVAPAEELGIREGMTTCAF